MKIPIIVGAILIVLVGWFMMAHNSYVALHNKNIAQGEVCKANLNNLFTTVAEAAQVPQAMMESSKEAFKEIYPELMKGRYGNARGGALMSWVQESNPNFDMKAIAPLYERVQMAIESNRENFKNQQVIWVDIARQEKTMLETMPNAIVLAIMGKKHLPATVIQTEEVTNQFQTGTGSAMNVFQQQ